MLDGFADGLIWPAVALALAGWLMPRLLSLVWPEGVGALLVLGFVATLLMIVLGTLAFLGLYLLQGVPLDVLFAPGVVPTLGHFLRLGLISALFWAPILILSVAGLPRHWTKETW